MARCARRLALLIAGSALGLGLTACSSSIQQDELETQVTNAIEGQFTSTPDVSCDGDLPAEVDATTECTATDPGTGEEIPLRITVTSVEGETAEFDIEQIE